MAFHQWGLKNKTLRWVPSHTAALNRGWVVFLHTFFVSPRAESAEGFRPKIYQFILNFSAQTLCRLISLENKNLLIKYCLLSRFALSTQYIIAFNIILISYLLAHSFVSLSFYL